jgi:hypothetical protein
MANGIDAEDLAVLVLLVADGELEVPAADVADLLEATERRARASFGPEPGLLRQALAGLVLESALARRGELAEGSVDDALARIPLGDLIGPILSQDRLWFSPGGAVHWIRAAPATLADPGTRKRVQTLLAIATTRPPPSMVIAILGQIGADRSFIRELLERETAGDDDDLRRQAAYQDWYE